MKQSGYERSEPGELARECDVFCTYLCGAPQDAYVRDKYLAAHRAGVVELPDTSRFEHALVRIARTAPWLARCMDAHSRVFGNGNLLRRKLVLLLGVLESRWPSAELVDAPTPGSNQGMFARMAWLAALFALRVVLSALALLPVRLVCALGGRR